MSKFKPNSEIVPGRARTPKTPGRHRSVDDAAGLPELTTEPPAVAVAVAEEEPQATIFGRIGFAALLVYIFFRFSFLHEFISGKLGIDTHIIITVSVVCYACTLLSGVPFIAFQNKISWFWCGFAVCMCIATATSFWIGGSLPRLLDYLRTVLPVVVMIPALVRSRKDIARLVNVIGIACAVTILLGIINSDFKTGRMGIASANSEIQDSNDYAAHIILMIPALTYLTMREGRNILFKLAGVAFLAIGAYEILSTGSRGGLLSIAITALYVVITGSNKVRALIVIGVPILAIAAIPFVPQESAARLKTLFSSEGREAAEAVESQQSRLALLQASWNITVHHPLTGIGPGEFMDYQAQEAKSEGERAMWHVTHNAYTQVSSECGVPAAIFYLSALISTFLIFRRGRQSRDPEIAMLASTLAIMLLSFGVTVFFLSLAYNVQFVTLSGVAIVLQFLLQNRALSPADEPIEEASIWEEAQTTAWPAR